jgi:hypothetical protein
MIVTKIEAAQSQLNTAIRLFFGNEDPISAHTLAGAASVIFADLIKKEKPEKAWEKHAQDVNKISPGQYYKIARKAQNFLKHAQSDSDKSLDFDGKDTETLMMFAVMNCAELLGTLSMEMSVFQLWYLASRVTELGGRDEILLKAALALFPGFETMERSQRIALGQKALNDKFVKETFGKSSLAQSGTV